MQGKTQEIDFVKKKQKKTKGNARSVKGNKNGKCGSRENVISVLSEGNLKFIIFHSENRKCRHTKNIKCAKKGERERESGKWQQVRRKTQGKELKLISEEMMTMKSTMADNDKTTDLTVRLKYTRVK